MSYSAPTGNAVAFTFVGATSYTAPTGNAVAFAWAVDASVTGATISNTASLTAGTATATATIARPNADTATGAWTPSTGVTLYGCIDEATYDDADYISTTTTAAATLALSAATDPAASTDHVIRFRAKSPFGNTLTVTLKQGGTTIKTATTAALTGSFADYTVTLSGAEADSITDYSALSLTLQAA